MSNNQGPTGFSFVRNYYNAAPTFQTSVVQIASTNTNMFGKGDVMKPLNTGYIDRALTTDSVFLGVLDRVEYFDLILRKKVFANAWLAPASAMAGSALAYVVDDPQAVFGVQAGNSNAPIGISAQGNNINFGGNAAPNTLNQMSVAYADAATIATTATLPFRVVNVPQNMGAAPATAAPITNDSTSAYNYIEVIGNAWLAKSTTGV